MSDTEAVVAEPTTNGAKRGRGRPKKDPNSVKAVKESKAQDNGVSDGTNGSDGEQREQRVKRGRKAKSAPKEVIQIEANNGVSKAKRGRGRPKKSAKGRGSALTGKKRGRKPGSKKSESVEEEAAPIDETIDDEEHEDQEEDEDEEED